MDRLLAEEQVYLPALIQGLAEAAQAALVVLLAEQAAQAVSRYSTFRTSKYN